MGKHLTHISPRLNHDTFLANPQHGSCPLFIQLIVRETPVAFLRSISQEVNTTGSQHSVTKL